jgi:hypothetical protein
MTQTFSVHNCKQHVVISLKYQFYGTTIPLTSVISNLQTRFISNVASMFMIYPTHTRRQGRASGAVASGGTVHGAANWTLFIKNCDYLRSKYIKFSAK